MAVAWRPWRSYATVNLWNNTVRRFKMYYSANYISPARILTLACDADGSTFSIRNFLQPQDLFYFELSKIISFKCLRYNLLSSDSGVSVR